MDRVSVPLWGTFLSEPLPIVALVGRYPANKLIGREPIRRRRNFQRAAMQQLVPSWISRRFHRLSTGNGHVAHALRTLPPVAARTLPPRAAPRLACVKPAASVHPEPGSNSSLYIHCFSRSTPTTSFLIFKKRNQRSSFFVLGTCCTNLSILSMNLPFFPKRAAKIATFSYLPNFF